MKYIEFGKINKKLLIPVLGGILMLIIFYIIKIIPKYDVTSKNPLILNIYVSIGMILAFIPHLILKNKIKKHIPVSKVLQVNQKYSIDIIRERVRKKIIIKKYLLILCSEVFDFAQIALVSFFSFKCIYNFWTFNILLMSLFSRLILKIQLYKHQYISIIIMIVFGLIMNILEYYKKVDVEDKLDILGISMTFLSEICLCLSMVIIKYNMEKNFCSPYEICIWEGTLSLIFNTIILIVANCLKLNFMGFKHPDNFYDLFGNYDIYDFLVCLVEVILNAIYNIILFTTCYFFDPCYILITLIIIQLYHSLETFNNAVLNILSFICLIIVSLVFLVYSEIIEVNIFNISYNKKKNIITRSLTESFIENDESINPIDDISSNGEDENPSLQ